MNTLLLLIIAILIPLSIAVFFMFLYNRKPTIYDANLIVTEHLLKVCEDRNYDNVHITRMLYTLKDNIEYWPIDKSSRWIGFIQGVMFKDGIIDLDEERYFTRPIFHSVYKNPPNTVKVYD